MHLLNDAGCVAGSAVVFGKAQQQLPKTVLTSAGPLLHVWVTMQGVICVSVVLLLCVHTHNTVASGICPQPPPPALCWQCQVFCSFCCTQCRTGPQYGTWPQVSLSGLGSTPCRAHLCHRGCNSAVCWPENDMAGRCKVFSLGSGDSAALNQHAMRYMQLQFTGHRE